MTGWRVFIGRWEDGDPEWTHLNVLVGDYEHGRSTLDERFVRWRADRCADCAETAAKEHAHLLSLQTDQEFAGEVEGEDYLLIRSDRAGNIDALWAARIAATSSPTT